MAYFRKFMSGLLTFSTSLALTGLGMVSTAYGAQLKSSSVTLSDVRSGQSSNYTIAFTLASATSVLEIGLQFANTASGATIPTNMDLSSGVGANPSAITFGADATTDWTIDKSSASSGLLRLYRSTSATVAADQAVSFTIDGIANNTTSGSGLCDNVTDSDTCWLQVKTYSAANLTGLIDQTTTTYTVINPITVTATVDPILTFTVAGVSASSITTNDAQATGSTTTSTATAITFGNVTVGTAKVAQQQLNVTTNANNGYTVYNKFIGSNVMTGSAVTSNNIDPFTESSATWGVPKAWAAPSGTTPNTNTGELGMRTTDSDIAGSFPGADKWGPPALGAGSGNAVMSSTASDNGTSAVYVTYKLQVNANQPADSYSGTTVFNAVATY